MQNYLYMKRTDMAVEFGFEISEERESGLYRRSVVHVDKALSEKTGKAQGKYITVETKVVRDGDRSGFMDIAEELSASLRELTSGENCLIVGLGNPDMTADSLGKCVLDRIMVTRHLHYGKGIPSISGVCPNVLGVTGIESYDIIKGVVGRIKPDCVIAVDSLAGAAVGRIASAFQLSDAGITPGSGVSNHRARLDRKSLGCTVVSLGVPLVVYASTIIEDAYGGQAEQYDSAIASMIVTPKDIDLYVADCANVIAKAINIAFFGADFEGLI